MSDTLKWALSKCDKPTSSVELNRAAAQAIQDEIEGLREYAEQLKALLIEGTEGYACSLQKFREWKMRVLAALSKNTAEPINLESGGKDDCRKCQGSGLEGVIGMTPENCTRCGGTGKESKAVLGVRNSEGT